MQILWHKLHTFVCPWWFTPTFDNPLRWLAHNPEKILGSLVKPGMTVADIGCGMGYFTIPLARMVGEEGRVYAVDIQRKSLGFVNRRAVQAGVKDRIQIVLAGQNKLELREKVDFILTNWMVHETPDPGVFLEQVVNLLKSGGQYLLVEPLVHVSGKAFSIEVDKVLSLGLKVISEPDIFFSRAVLFSKG
ncbi:MAG: cyclopropane-fatty-acyl-phospholipid synthase family protein [Anaerolineaceae bacterium]